MPTSIDDLDFASLFAAAREQDVFPDVELITRRMRLRPYTEADTDGHLEIFDSEVARRWSSVPRPYPYGEAHTWCTRSAVEVRESGDGICWAVEDRTTGDLVGVTGLHRTDWDNRVTDLSANAGPTILGRGYATEALRVICHWVLAEQGFVAIHVDAASDNRAALLVARSCGFRAQFATPETQPGQVRYALLHDELPATPEYSVRTRRTSR